MGFTSWSYTTMPDVKSISHTRVSSLPSSVMHFNQPVRQFDDQTIKGSKRKEDNAPSHNQSHISSDSTSSHSPPAAASPPTPQVSRTHRLFRTVSDNHSRSSVPASTLTASGPSCWSLLIMCSCELSKSTKKACKQKEKEKKQLEKREKRTHIGPSASTASSSPSR